MEIKKTLYGSPTRRTIMRVVEIFLISGIIGVIDSGAWQALVPAGMVGIVAGILKWVREYLDNRD